MAGTNSLLFSRKGPMKTRLILNLFSTLSQLSPALAPAEQVNYLEHALEAYIEPENAYGSLADVEVFPQFIGETSTKTRPGLKAPIQLVTDAAIASTGSGGLDNGVTPADPAIEQYVFTPGTYEDGANIDIAVKNFMIVDRFRHYVKMNAIQAMQSRDVLCRDALIKGYLTGTAQVTTGAPYSLTTTPQAVHVDDIRGLSTAIQNGVESAVTGSNTLAAVVYPAGNPTGSYAITISAAAADSTSTSPLFLVGSPAFALGTSRGNGVSGTVTIALASGTKTLSQQDVIIAGDAPAQFLPNAKSHWSYLNAGDLLTQNMLLDARTYLEDQGVEPLDDGTFLMVSSHRSLRALWSDQDFQQAWRGLGQSDIYSRGRVDKYLGITFLRSTNAPRIAITTGVQSNQPATGYVHLPMMMGKGNLVDVWYEGLEDWANNENQNSVVKLNRLGLAQVITKPIDRMGRQLKMSWLTIRDAVAPTDVTANSTIVLTAGNSRRKRGVIMPHGASV